MFSLLWLLSSGNGGNGVVIIDNSGGYVVMADNTKAELVYEDRRELGEGIFVEAVLWRLPRPVPGSEHSFKYRLALVIDDECVLRYDNERGKGDHRHYGEREEPYRFTTPEALFADFGVDARRLLK